MKYIGIDLSDKAIELAKINNEKAKDSFFVGDILQIDYSHYNYNTVVIFEVLEHINNDREIFKKIRKGSKIFFSVPNFPDYNHFRVFENIEAILYSYGEYIDILSYEKHYIINNSVHHIIECIKK